MTQWLKLCTQNAPFVLSFFLIILAAGYTNCNTSNVGSSGEGSGAPSMSILSSAGFTKDAYAEVLRSTYLKLAYQLPDSLLLSNIQNAATDEEAKSEFERGIDLLVDTGLMEKRFQNYFKNQFDVWSDSTAENQAYMRYPVNLGVYIALSDISIDELFLADYTTDDDYNVINPYIPDTNQPPIEDAAGFITLDAYATRYINQFKFHIVREVFGLALNTVAPFTDVDIYRWDPSMLSYIYRYDPDTSDINCETCHVVYNWSRLAFRNYEAQNTLRYRVDNVQGNVQFDAEEVNPDMPDGALEPRNASDAPYPEEDLDNYVKLTEQGSPLRTPRDLALALTQHPKFPKAWTERILTIVFEMPEGTAGTNKEVPQFFQENDTQIEFIEKWSGTFESENRVIKEFLRLFLKDKDYIGKVL